MEYVVGRDIKKGEVVRISESGMTVYPAENAIPLIRASQDLPKGTKVVIEDREILVKLEEGYAGTTDWTKGLVG